MNTTRKTELDVAKGFAIFLVVFGHVVPIHDTIFRWIFSFHMPAFFFLSGMTFRPEKYPDYRTLLKDKFRRRIIPYFLITAVAFVICMIRPDYRQLILEDGWQKLLVWIFYYGQPMGLYVGQVWFLVALFMAEVISYTWFRCFGEKPLLTRCTSLVLLAVAAMYIRRIDVLIPLADRLPWKIDTALCASVFLIAGYYANKGQVLERLRPVSPVLIPICIWFSYYFGPQLINYVNICDCIYNAPPYYYTAAFLGIGALTMTAMLCKRSRFWQFCGRYSMQIFAAQTFVIYFVVEMIERFTGIHYEPMLAMPGDKVSLAVSIAAFAIMLAVLYPWSLYKERQMKQQAKENSPSCI